MLSEILKSPITLSKKLILKANVDYSDKLNSLSSDVISRRHNIFIWSEIISYASHISYITQKMLILSMNEIFFELFKKG